MYPRSDQLALRGRGMSPPAAGYIFKCSLKPFFLPPAARDGAYDGLKGKFAGDRKKDSVLWLAPLPLKEAKKRWKISSASQKASQKVGRPQIHRRLARPVATEAASQIGESPWLSSVMSHWISRVISWTPCSTCCR